MPADKRRATFLYIDEAHDYFDESIEQLFNQARKYKVWLIIAHQNLDQFTNALLASVMASTAIKLVGGMSAKDASALAKEMRCGPELLQSMRKHQDQDHSEFAFFVKNLTAVPLRLSVPFGTMERRFQLSDAEHEELLTLNRRQYAAGAGDRASGLSQPRAASDFELGRPEVFLTRLSDTTPLFFRPPEIIHDNTFIRYLHTYTMLLLKC